MPETREKYENLSPADADYEFRDIAFKKRESGGSQPAENIPLWKMKRTEQK